MEMGTLSIDMGQDRLSDIQEIWWHRETEEVFIGKKPEGNWEKIGWIEEK